MKYILLSLMFFLTIMHTDSGAYEGSTKAAVTLAGGIVKAQHTENTKKYKRKNCPVCKGKGWYISGDKISKVECGYCEPDTQLNFIPAPNPPGCKNNNCQIPQSVLKR